MRAAGWTAAVLAPVALVGGWTWAQARQPDGYDPVRDTISALAARDATDPWVMTAALVVLGACHVTVAAVSPAHGVPARVVHALGGVATLAVAASPQPAAAHVPAAGTAFVALALWPALSSRPVRRAGTVTTAVLAALLVWFGSELGGGALLGLSERVVAAAEALAPLVLAASAVSGRATRPDAGGARPRR